MNILFHIILAIGFLFKSDKQNIPTETAYPFQLGDKTINVIVTEFDGTGNLVMINLHDNEQTSVTAGKQVLEEKGGILIRIENQNTRLISFKLDDKKYKFDPNRMFTPHGADSTLKENCGSTPEAINLLGNFANHILSTIPNSAETIIALHNNTESGFSIHSYSSGGIYQHEAAKYFINDKKDPDDFFLATTHKLYLKVKTKGFNTVLQNNEDPTDDGSLSVFMKDKSYINVEAEHGHEEEQIIMLQQLLK